MPAARLLSWDHLSRFAPALAGIAAALSACIVIGWFTRDTDLLFMRLYVGPPMYLSVALVCLAAGLLLALQDHIPPEVRVHARVLFATLFIVLGGAYLAEVLLGLDLGIDFRDLHAAIDTLSRHPGRPSPNASTAILLLGVALASPDFGPARYRRALALTSAGLIAGIGLFGLLVYAFDLRFFNLWVAQTSLAAPTAVVFSLLGIALLGATQSRRQDDVRAFSDFQQIVVTSVSVLVIIVMIIGLSSLAVMQQQLQHVEEQLTLTAVGVRQRSIERELGHAALAVQRDAAQFAAGPSIQGPAGAAAELGAHIRRWPHVAGLRLRDAQDRVLAHTGTFPGGPDLALTLAGADSPRLAVGPTGYMLLTREELRRAGRAPRWLEFAQALPAASSLLALRLPWPGAMLFLCAGPPTQPSCFSATGDGRVADLGAPGTRLGGQLARHGPGRAFQGLDLAGKPAILGYQPVGATGLRVGFAIPAVEIYTPSRIALQRLIAIMLLCVAAGVVVLSKRLRPLTRRLEAAMHEARDNYEHFITAAESAQDALSLLLGLRDESGQIRDFRFVYANRTAAAALGRSPSELIGSLLLQHRQACADVDAFFAQCVQVIETGVPATFDSLHPGANGKRYLRHLSKSGDQVFSIGRDVTQTLQNMHELTALALTDSLTQLPNRRALEQALQGACERALHSPQGVAVVYCDLDDFKSINDSYGHACGDEFLIAFAHALQGAVRKTDLVARLSGDEFVVLLEQAGSTAEVDRVTEAIRAALDHPVQLCGRTLTLRASVGYALAHGAEAVPAELLQRADTAMYREKTARKAQVRREADAAV